MGKKETIQMALELMLKGMSGIIVTITIIMCIIYIMQKIGKQQNRK